MTTNKYSNNNYNKTIHITEVRNNENYVCRTLTVDIIAQLFFFIPTLRRRPRLRHVSPYYIPTLLTLFQRVLRTCNSTYVDNYHNNNIARVWSYAIASKHTRYTDHVYFRLG